jgi:hypothetical protein
VTGFCIVMKFNYCGYFMDFNGFWLGSVRILGGRSLRREGREILLVTMERCAEWYRMRYVEYRNRLNCRKIRI